MVDGRNGAAGVLAMLRAVMGYKDGRETAPTLLPLVVATTVMDLHLICRTVISLAAVSMQYN